MLRLSWTHYCPYQQCQLHWWFLAAATERCSPVYLRFINIGHIAYLNPAFALLFLWAFNNPHEKCEADKRNASNDMDGLTERFLELLDSKCISFHYSLFFSLYNIFQFEHFLSSSRISRDGIGAVWMLFLLCVFPQDHLSERNPADSTNQDAADQSQGFILVDEPHIVWTTNTEDVRRAQGIKSSPSIRTSDENIIQQSAVETALTSPDSPIQTSEVKSNNVTSVMYKNRILSMTPKGHWESNRPFPHLRSIEEGQHSSLQHMGSNPSAPSGDLIYGSDQRIYRIHEGLSGPIGPQGSRVSISLSYNAAIYCWFGVSMC